MHHTVPALEMARAVQQNYLTPVVIFGSSSFTVDDFDPIVPVAKRSPPPTTITIRAPMRTPMTPIPPLLSAMHISSGCQLDAIQCFGCTFVPQFVRPTETAECLLLAQSRHSPHCGKLSVIGLPAQPVDATQALNLSAGVSNCKVLRGRSLS